MPKDIMGITTYTLEETAAIIGVSRRTMLTYLGNGKMVGSKIGGRYAITEQQIKDYVNKLSVVDNRPGNVNKLFDDKKQG